MKKLAIILLSLSLSMQTIGQIAPEKYFVEFTDKNNSPYSIDRPQEFLSPRALERRQNQGIPIEQNDIPVNGNYISAVANFGVTILNRSRWFNGITIYSLNPDLLDSISHLPFVKSTIKSYDLKHLNSDNKFGIEEVLLELNIKTDNCKFSERNTSFNYGPSYKQIHMLNGDSMHRMGFRGKGKIIAVLDAGFYHADILPAFDSLWSNNQILGTKDFVTPGNNVFLEYEHGMEVLSTIGGNIPGQLIGSAPEAKFWLLRTEEKASENIIEEYNWESAAEFADSAGVDIINSSLGYTTFDDTIQNHACSDMNGNTTPVTMGANIAVAKGMIVVNSAGNSGGSSWRCVGAPADGFSVIAVAAVDSNGIRAPFSSVGEKAKRIKPNVAAMGLQTVMSSPTGTITRRNGTSFSSPLIAGMVACLWQAAPTWSNTYIMRAIELSSNQISNPDSLLGYGIPDFPKALLQLSATGFNDSSKLQVYPNPYFTTFKLTILTSNDHHFDIQIFDQLGRIRYAKKNQSFSKMEQSFELNDLIELPVGNYILRVVSNSFTYITKLIKASR